MVRRRPERLSSDSALGVVPGDIRDAASVDRAVHGVAAVVSALGVNTLRGNRSLSRGTSHLVAAMGRHGVSRLVVCTALGVGDSRADRTLGGRLYARAIFPVLSTATAFIDKERQEEVVRASGLDWTIVRPAPLSNGPATGAVVAGFTPEATTGKGTSTSIARTDVAAFLLDQVEDRTASHQALTIVGGALERSVP